MMRRWILISAILLVLVASSLMATLKQRAAGSGTATPAPTPEPSDAILFDDFNYDSPDDSALSDNGWIVRTADGWPGVPGAIWRKENVSFLADPDDETNHLMEMTSSTDGKTTYQTQVCQGRKFYEGTYATRVHWSNAPDTGPDGDNVVETFYLISPQKFDMDPDYSELDFEYLPNGGWGNPNTSLDVTTWETFQLDPWIADNDSDSQNASFRSWHTLVLQIMDGEGQYYVDGEPFATHGGKYYPEVPMSINYNLWFIQDGQISSSESRDYIEQVDWVYFAANTALMPEDIDARVAALRSQQTPFTDTVPDWSPHLESPCNF